MSRGYPITMLVKQTQHPLTLQLSTTELLSLSDERTYPLQSDLEVLKIRVTVVEHLVSLVVECQPTVHVAQQL